MSTPVLATKLLAPVRRPRLVARPRLAQQLDATLDPGHRLTLISAPAGFGKTTVLSDWLDHLAAASSDTRVAWVSLDDGDNDLPRLLTHVVAALRGAGLDVETPVLASLGADPSAALTALVNAISYAGELAPDDRWLLVLDDYHLVTAHPVHEALGFLVDHLPSQLHLVLATRADPTLPLSRLRTRGQLTEVRAADLRFTADEAREFLTGTMGLDLGTDDVAALADRTEGWVAGLQLAALSLRETAGPQEASDFVEAFAGSNRFVLDYLVDEVLARQPEEVRAFLRSTAVLDRLTGPLCDAVTGRSDGARMLEELDRANLFVIPLGDDRRWYRYHHLFADVLHARLLAEQPELVPTLHQRASAWHASQDLVVDAVRHALTGQDFATAARLTEQALPDLRRARQDGLLAAWAASLPEEVLRRSPVLSLLSAWSRLMAGDLDAASARLDDAEAALAAGAVDPSLAATWADTEDLRTAPAMVEVYRASLAQARGDVGGTVAHAQRAVDLAGPEDHFIRGAGGGFLGLAAWAAGDIARALTTFTEAARSLRAAGNLVDVLDTTIVRADMCVALGRPSQARRLYDEALRSVVAAGEPYPRATADLHVGLAELDHERDDLVRAETHLETARVLAERTSITENRHRWYLAAARLRASRGDLDAALDLLDTAKELYRPGFYPDLRPIPAFRARLQIAAGHLDAAADWAVEHGIGPDDEAEYLREYDHLTLARLLIARSRAPEALGLLDRLLEAATEAGRDGSVLEARVIRARTLHEQGDRAGAVDELGTAWAEAPEPEEWVRLLLDEGAPMLELLRRAAPEHARAHRLLQRAAAVRPPVRGSLPDPLSQRELEVLRLLDSELTGPEIARQLYVSLNTLRTHTKRIFTKLDVSSRAAALRRARDLGLL